MVDAGLEAHNCAVAPLADVTPMAAFAADPSGKVIGGAVGRTWGRCCELLQLWVTSEHRASGVGSRLLREFEAINDNDPGAHNPRAKSFMDKVRDFFGP